MCERAAHRSASFAWALRALALEFDQRNVVTYDTVNLAARVAPYHA